VISDALSLFTQQTLDAVAEHAAEHPKEEVCGLVVAVRQTQVVMRPENAQVDDRNKRARIGGEDFRAAEEMGDILAMYHSHVDEPARPSPGDIRASERLALPYLIYSARWKQFAVYQPDGHKVPLVGRPWVEGELDCLTLFHDYYEEVLGLKIAEYEWDFGMDERDAKRIADGLGFVMVHPNTKRAHDILMLDLPGLKAVHFAIYLPDGRLLHHAETKISARLPYGSWFRAGTRAVFRHRSQLRDTDAVHDESGSAGDPR
jgi:proteasome lid subunit RPN8/RPN11